ncbi:MAG: poly-gamma-glutamate synthase PgsB [Myxococcota bacterium]
MRDVLAPQVLTGLAGFVILWLAIEALRHRAALRRIPVRIHVNGTRGKSSVTRLLAAGLRAGGHRTVAKTTGTLARVLLPAGRELPVYRPLGANVREQIRIVRFAARAEADVLVVECMALQPILQWLSERMFVRATHGVITNARPDHLDVMGPGGDDVARALAGMMPVGGLCVTAEEARRDVLALAAKDRGCRLVALRADDVAQVSDAVLAGFGHIEHRENVAVALALCEALDVPRQTALEGMWAATPDPGALTFDQVDFFGRRIVFANAFAANDPESSERIWNLCLARFPSFAPIALFNCRPDRADRSRQLGQALPRWHEPQHVIAAGLGTGFFARAAVAAGYDASALTRVERTDPREVFERVIEHCGDATLVVGLGNIGGLGLELVRLFRNRATRPRRPVVARAPQAGVKA